MTHRDTMPVTAAVALAAATLAYALHHLSMPAHSPWAALGAVVGAATIGLLPAVLAARPRRPLPVVLARSEALAVREAVAGDAGFCAALHAERLPEDAVDGRLVARQREAGSPAHTLTRELISGGAFQVGSPWALPGLGFRSFTDEVHLDHIHLQQAAR